MTRGGFFETLPFALRRPPEFMVGGVMEFNGVGDRDGEVRGQGCGVRRRSLAGGPVDNEPSLAPQQ